MDKKKEIHIPSQIDGDGISEDKITESKFDPNYVKPPLFTDTEIGTPNSASETVSNSLLL